MAALSDLYFYADAGGAPPTAPETQRIRLGCGVSGAVGGGIMARLSSADRPTGLQVQVFRNDNYRTPAHVVTPSIPTGAGTFAREWQPRLNERGSGKLTVLNSGPDRAEIRCDDTVRLLLDGRVVASFLVDTLESATLPAATEQGQPPATTVASGSGPLALLDRGAVVPSLGWDRLPVQFDRVLGWPDVRFPDYAWPTAVSYGTYADPGLVDWFDQDGNPWPEKWPLVSGSTPAQWCGPPSGTATNAAPLLNVWGRRKLTITVEGDHVLYFSCDNTGEAYLDGFKLATSKGFMGTSVSDPIRLDAGTHQLAFHVANAIDDGPPGDNPCGYIFELWRQENGLPVERVAYSDGTELLVESPYPPGMTDGQIIRMMVEENQAEGWLPGLELSFDDDTDSAGVPWAVKGERTTKVGGLGKFLIEEMAGQTVDLRVRDGAPVLDAYVLDGLGVALDLTLQAVTDRSDPTSGNLTELSHTRSAIVAGDLMVQYQHGWRKVSAPDYTGPAKVATLGLGTYRSADQVDVTALSELERYARQREAIVAGVLPQVLIDAGARVGDTLVVPGYDGTTSRERIIGLTFSEDETGKLTVVPELKDLLRQFDERHELWLSKMAEGTVDGTSPVAQPIVVGADTGGATCCPPEPVSASG